MRNNQDGVQVIQYSICAIYFHISGTSHESLRKNIHFVARVLSHGVNHGENTRRSFPMLQ